MSEIFKENNEGGEDHFEAIQEAFRAVSPVNREMVEREITSRFDAEEILDAVDDNESAEARPDVLFLILDILDPKSESKKWVAQMVIESPQSDKDVRDQAVVYIHTLK